MVHLSAGERGTGSKCAGELSRKGAQLAIDAGKSLGKVSDMTDQLFWFALAALPLIATPGPDILLCVAQGVTRGSSGVWRAVNGITLGYLAHAILAAIGLAALVAASPVLFETVRWLGIAYLTWLAFGMLRSALWRTARIVLPNAPPLSLWRGFLTSFLNPKGLLMYLSVLPQFIVAGENMSIQALALSAIFISLCYVVYLSVGLIAAHSSRSGPVSPLRARILDGLAGTMLGGVAVKLALEK